MMKNVDLIVYIANAIIWKWESKLEQNIKLGRNAFSWKEGEIYVWKIKLVHDKEILCPRLT